MRFGIRQFEKADFDTIWRIDQACFDPELAYSRPEMAYYMRRPGAFTLVAEADRPSNGPAPEIGLAPEVQPGLARSFSAGLAPDSSSSPGGTTHFSHAHLSHAHLGTSAPVITQPFIAGFVVAEYRRQHGHIITIDVVAEARRTGLGSALLQAAEEQLQREGAVEVALETPVNNVAAISFYKRHGYFVEKTVTGYYSGRLDALVMAKQLELAQ